MLLSAAPIYGRKAQPSPVHFFAEPVGIWLDRVADQTIPPASPYVSNNLLPNAFIKNDEILVFCIIKIHQARPVFNPCVSYEFTCFRPLGRVDINSICDVGMMIDAPAAARQRPSHFCRG